MPRYLQLFIRRMARHNPTWGERRIANDRLLELGPGVSLRTVRRYLPKRPSGAPRGDQRWSTFLRHHAQRIVACDFFVSITGTFQLLRVFGVIGHVSRRILLIKVTHNRQPPGRYNSCGRRSALARTNTCCAIATVSSPSKSMNRLGGAVCKF